MSGVHRGYEKPAGAPVTRIGSGDPGDEGKLQRAIRGTGCTITEILRPKEGGKVACFLYGPKDDPAKAIGILKGMGYNVNVMTRKRPDAQA